MLRRRRAIARGRRAGEGGDGCRQLFAVMAGWLLGLWVLPSLGGQREGARIGRGDDVNARDG